MKNKILDILEENKGINVGPKFIMNVLINRNVDVKDLPTESQIKSFIYQERKRMYYFEDDSD